MLMGNTKIVATGLLMCWSVCCQGADLPVSLELATEQGFAIGGHQTWMRMLKELDFTTIRIRGARPGDEPKIENRGTDTSPRFAVTGVLTSDNRLHLPGLTIRYGQRKELDRWLSRLREGGSEAVTSPIAAFGLTPKQLLKVHDALQRAVIADTKGKPIGTVVQDITRQIQISVQIDPAAKRAMATGDDVADELRGLGCGTALAAAVRPFGLVVTPTGQGKRVVGIRIAAPQGGKQTWPIGTSPKRPPDLLAPNLFKTINVEINERPLLEALEAIQTRIEVPILFDHNALAKHGIEIESNVTLPPMKTFYKKIIDQLLFQLLLKSELRVDESDRAFIWVTSVKK